MSKSFLTSKVLPSMINLTPVSRLTYLWSTSKSNIINNAGTIVLLMQFGQLQDIEEQCNQVKQGLQSATQEEVESLRGNVKKRKAEIEELKQDVLVLKIEVKKKRQFEKKKEGVKAEIEKERSFTVKEKQQSNRLQDLIDQTEYKSKMQQKRIAEIQAQQAMLVEFQAKLQLRIQDSKRYSLLKKNLNVLSTQLLAQKMNNSLQLQRRNQQLKELDANNIKIEQQTDNLQQKIVKQQQTIEQLTVIEQQRINQDNSRFEILSKQEQAFFKKKPELDIWEKYEIQGLLQKREVEKEKERKIGSIWKQRLSTHSHKERPFVNRSLTYSQEQSSLHKESSDLLFISSERMKQLQKNKRIRTRYTEPKPQQAQVSLISYTQTGLQEQPDSRPSILTIYERLKNDRIPSQNSIKLLRNHNKRRSLNQQKGVSTQLQQFD